MASESSVAEQTTNGQVEEKKVIDDKKILEGESVYQHEEIYSGIYEPDELKVEQQATSETVAADTKETKVGKKDETYATHLVKKECEGDRVPAPGDLEDKKDDEPAVGDLKKENKDAKVFDSEVPVNKEDGTVVENVEEKAESSNMSSSGVPEVENAKADTEEKTTNTNPVEPLSEAVENLVVEPEVSSVEELEQIEKVTEVSEPEIKIAKTLERPSDITSDPALASEKVEQLALAAVEPACDTAGELEKVEIHESNQVLEASRDEKLSTNDVEIPCEVSKEDHDVKESINSSASQSLDVYAVCQKVEEANGDDSGGSCKEEPRIEGSILSETLVKELTVDPSLPRLPTVVGETPSVDNNLVTEAAQIGVKPEINAEQKEETLETELVVEQKDVKTVETETDEEQKEEKAAETNATLSAINEIGNPSYLDVNSTKAYTEEKNNSQISEDVTVAQRDLDVSDSAIEATEIPSENEKASEGSAVPKDESVADDTALVQASRDVDLKGQKDEADTSIKQQIGKPEEKDKVHVGNVAKDESEDKKDDDEKTGTQKLVEPSTDNAPSKTNTEVQKSEMSPKPKTLISKLKHSILKVKKAIIGKSPSTKTISAESKDEIEVR